MEAAVAHQIWNYIGMLGVDRETARDLYQEAETAVWEASTHRATHECHSYLVKTGIGAIRHWLRDRYAIIRIPGYLHDRGEAASHMKTMLPLDEMTELVGHRFEEGLVEDLSGATRRRQVRRLLPRLTRAERQVMESLLSGQSIRDIARERRVRVGCVYAQRSKAISKLRKLVLDDSSFADEEAQPRRAVAGGRG
jgi:RNA polymerase sigma factor (sigma-70 family)